MKKVYIVDDDRDIVDSISIVLKANNYDVNFQYDENEVVKNVENYKPDAIILDVMFPEDQSAGFSIARQLKNKEATKNIPIIMLSAINERGIYVGKFSDHDIDDVWLPVNMFVEKPIDNKTLLEKVNMVLK